MDDSARDLDAHDWPFRAWVLAGGGALVGYLIYQLVGIGDLSTKTPDAWRLAVATFLAVGGLGLAYTIERGRAVSSVMFAIVAGLIMGSIIYSNSEFAWGAGEPWRLACGALTVAIGTPLFMAWRESDGRRWAISYQGAHNRAWTNTVLWFSSWLFTGLVWALAWLLAALFNLIGISFLSELLSHGWFVSTLTGGALGGAIGLLRDRERILATLRSVVTTVLGVLAPVLAVGLILFLIALPFTGLHPLWAATKATTPILLNCVIGALILGNAVIGDTDSDESRHPVLRWSALALGLAILPLGVIAAVSTGLRIGQYGLSPDRLWAVVFTGIACAYGLAYLVSVVRGRLGWASLVRPANLRLAIGLCVVAFLLSTPLLSFGAMSTRDQLARLADGRAPADTFDWRALRWDFGPAGKAALDEMAKSGATPAIRLAAATAAKSESRYGYDVIAAEKPLETRLTVLPKPVALPPALHDFLETDYSACRNADHCTVVYQAGSNEAVVVRGNDVITPLRLQKNAWIDAREQFAPFDPEIMKRRDAAIAKADVVIKTVQRRQVFVGGEPVGAPFE